MDEQAGQSSTKRTLVILGAVVGVLIILMGFVALTDNPKERMLNTSQGKIEILTANELKARINLFRVQEGDYPYDYDELMKTIPPKDGSDYRTTLKDLNYSRKGDGEAYRFTYINVAEELVTIEGNYSEDYH
jgi:hypothetical protein